MASGQSSGLEEVHSDGHSDNPYLNNWTLLDQRTNVNPQNIDVNTGGHVPSYETQLLEKDKTIENLDKQVKNEIQIRTNLEDKVKETLLRYNNLEKLSESQSEELIKIKGSIATTSIVSSQLQTENKDLKKEKQNAATQLDRLNKELQDCKKLDWDKTTLIEKMKVDFENLKSEILNVRSDANSFTNLMTEVMNQNTDDTSENLVAELRTELEHLREECGCWNDQLKIARQRENTVNTIVVDLKAKLCVEETYVKQLKAQLLVSETEKLTEADIENLQAQQELMRKLKIQLQSSKKQYQERVGLCNELESSIKKKNNVISDKDKEMDGKKKEIGSLKRQVLVKSQRIKDLERLSGEKSEDIQSQSEKLIEIEKKLRILEDSKRRALVSLGEKSDELQKAESLLSRFTTAENEARILYDEHSSSLEKELHKVKENCRQKENQIKDLTDSLSNISKDITLYKNEIMTSELNRQLSEARENESLREQLSAEITRAQNLEAQLYKVSEVSKQKDFELAKLRSIHHQRRQNENSFEKLKVEYGMKANEIEGELERSRNVLTEQIETIEKLKKLQISTQRKLESKSYESTKLSKNNEMLRKEAEALDENLVQSENVVAKLQEKISSLKADARYNESSKQQLLDKLNDVINDKDSFAKEVHDLKKQLKAISKANVTNTVKLSNLESSSGVSRSDMSSIVDFIQKCTTELDRKSQGLNQAQVELKEYKKNNEAFKVALDNKTKECKRTSAMLRLVQKQVQEARNDLKQQDRILEERSAKLNDKNSQIHELSAKVGDGERNFAVAMAECEATGRGFDGYQKLVQEKCTQNKELQEEMKMLRSSADKLRMNLIKEQNEKKSLKALIQDNELGNDRSRDHELLEGTIEALKRHLSGVSNELSIVTDRLKLIQQELVRTKSQLLASESANQLLRSDIDKTNQLLETQKLANEKLVNDFISLENKRLVTNNHGSKEMDEHFQLKIETLNQSLKNITVQKDTLMQQFSDKVAECEKLRNHVRTFIQNTTSADPNQALESQLSTLILNTVQKLGEKASTSKQVEDWVQNLQSNESLPSNNPATKSSAHSPHTNLHVEFQKAENIISKMDDILRSDHSDLPVDLSLDNVNTLSLGSVTTSILSNDKN